MVRTACENSEPEVGRNRRPKGHQVDLISIKIRSITRSPTVVFPISPTRPIAWCSRKEALYRRVRCATRSLLLCATRASSRHRFYALGVLRHGCLHTMLSISTDGPHLMVDLRYCNGRTTFPTLSRRQLYISVSCT